MTLGPPTLRHLAFRCIALLRFPLVALELLPRELLIEFLCHYCLDYAAASIIAGRLFNGDRLLIQIASEAARKRARIDAAPKKITKLMPLSKLNSRRQIPEPLNDVPPLLHQKRSFEDIATDGEVLCFVSTIKSIFFANHLFDCGVLEVFVQSHTQDAQRFVLSEPANLPRAQVGKTYCVSGSQFWSVCDIRYVQWILDPLLAGSEALVHPIREIDCSHLSAHTLRFVGVIPYRVVFDYANGSAHFHLEDLTDTRKRKKKEEEDTITLEDIKDPAKPTKYDTRHPVIGSVLALARPDTRYVSVHNIPERTIILDDNNLYTLKPIVTANLCVDMLLSTRVWAQKYPWQIVYCDE